jgi:hypothetical protein
VAVHAFNQRSVEDILAMIETVGRLAQGTAGSGMRTTFQGLPGPNPRLTLLDEGS